MGLSWNPITDVGNYVVKPVTNALGITHDAPPDLSKGPDAQALRDFATSQAQQAPMARAAGYNTGASNEDRARQQQAIEFMHGAAAGTAPSAAEQMLRQSTDAANANALGIAAAGQGVNPGAAMRAGLQAGSVGTQNASAGAAALRANEMANARGQYVDALGNLRTQDVGDAQFRAGLDQQTNLANQQSQLQQQGYNNQRELGLGSLTAGALQAPYNTALQNQQLQLQNQAANSVGVGSLLGAGATALSKSDETSKKDIHAGGGEADEFLKGLDPKTYRYKDPNEAGASPGDHLGVLAQHMTDGVKIGADGKRWISADVIGNVLAGMGRLHERLSGVEGRRG